MPDDDRDVRPDPDPTRLTLAEIRGQVASLQALMNAQLATMEERHNTIRARLDAVDERFTHIDEMRREMKDDHLRSLDTALGVAKETSERLESSITRSFAEQTRMQETDARRLEQKIDGLAQRFSDLTERVVSIEQRREGAQTDRTGVYATVGALVALALVVLELLQLLG